MIYLNQAATTWPKPMQTKQAVQAAIALPPFAQNRSVSLENENILEVCRRKLSQLFHIEDRKRIFFTSGATDSFNRIIRGLELEGKKVFITANEHNAVLRPLYNMYEKLKIEIVNCDKDGNLLYEELENRLTADVSAVFVNHCSNVTGKIVDLERIARIVHTTDAILIVDGSQSAGHMEIDVDRMGIDILVFTGHKGLFGLQGTGGYYIREGVCLKPCVYGGTGYDSKRLVMPADNREYEVGTQNLHGIAGLAAGADYILEKGVEVISREEEKLVTKVRQGLCAMQKVTVYGSDDKTIEPESVRRQDKTGPVVSFSLQGIEPSDVAYILANNYDIFVRSGYHCAPLIHESLGCGKSGTVRVSVSCLNTLEEVETLLEAISELEQSL